MPDTRDTTSRAGRTGAPEQAPLGRRILAVAIDWALAVAISAGFFGYEAFATLGIFVLMRFVLVGTIGMTIGHRVLGIGVRAIDGGPPGFARAFVRAIALALVIPAVITDPEGRGLHDRWANTQIVRL